MEIFKGKIKDFTGRTLLEEAREEYEKIKDPALDAAAEKLLKALADYLNLAIEKRDTVAISSIYEAMVGGLFWPDGVQEMWQVELTHNACSIATGIILQGIKCHGAD